MSERARALSGRLTAAPHPDGGFEVCAELPVPNP
jgi:signal transduction histidine kinase